MDAEAACFVGASRRELGMTATEHARDLAGVPSAGSAAAQRPHRRRVYGRGLAVGGAILVAVVVGWLAMRYYAVGRFVEKTDDAYVKADATIVAPKVAGYVEDLLVDDNQSVKAGQVVARIDNRDLHNALDEAAAGLSSAHADVDNLAAQITAQGSLVRQADASVVEANASLGLAQRNDARRKEMARVGYGSAEQADNASTDTSEKAASLQRLKAAAVNARQQIEVLTTQRQMAQAQLARAEAAQHQAELNLSYATITSPTDGTVAARTARRGQYVQVGTQLMAVVPLQRVYVVANFKETQLTGVKPGERARIRVDTFPGHVVEGRVDSLAPASGLEFSLLPPDNATGNFTKIVQRIPVKVVFDRHNSLAGRLRPGMSVDVSIDTASGG